MSSIGGPATVTSGLVLELDAGNIKSYQSGSTTWFDKSGNGYNGTLTNGPTFNTGSLGSIVFDGVDDYVQTSTLVVPSTGAFTLGFFYKITNSTNRGGLFERKNGDPYNGVSLGQGGDNNWVFTVSSTSDFNNRLSVSATYPTLNVWYCDVGVYNGTDTVSFYRNGVLIGSSTGVTQGNLNTQGTRDNLLIFKRDNSSGTISGNVSQTFIYNRALSTSEVQQNFNATRARFGI
jgi:hypothetical protein